MKASIRIEHSEVPSKAAAAVAAVCGLVLGALGGGILLGANLAVLILIAFGVWRGVSYLAVIAAALTDLDHQGPAEHAVDDITETVRIS